MRLERLLLAAMLLGLPLAARAQYQPGDVRVDQRDIRVCARVGCLAGGDTLANEIARAQGAEAAAMAKANGAVPAAGGTMTGPLVLSGPPTQPLHPATKAYSDAETTRAQGAEQAVSTAAANASNLAAGTVPAGRLVNRTPATPLTTTVGTTLTTILPAGPYVSVRIKLVVPNPLTCTGDGGVTSATALPGMDLHWPNDQGQMAPGPFQCWSTVPGTVIANAY